MRIDVFGKDVFNKDNGNGILKIVCKSESSDEINCRCLWAVIYFDVKQGIMTACTDCGNYAYMWSETGFKFLYLMSKVGTEYLLRKVAKKNSFDFGGTVRAIKSEFTDADNYEEIEAYIDDIEHFDDARDFIECVEEYDDNNLLDGIVIWDCVKCDYEPQAKTFAELFVTYVQPKIREVLKTYD